MLIEYYYYNTHVGNHHDTVIFWIKLIKNELQSYPVKCTTHLSTANITYILSKLHRLSVVLLTRPLSRLTGELESSKSNTSRQCIYCKQVIMNYFNMKCAEVQNVQLQINCFLHKNDAFKSNRNLITWNEQGELITPVVWTSNNNKTCCFFFHKIATYITYHTHKLYIYPPVMSDSWGPLQVPTQFAYCLSWPWDFLSKIADKCPLAISNTQNKSKETEKMSLCLHHLDLQTTLTPQKHRGGFETKVWVYEFLLKLSEIWVSDTVYFLQCDDLLRMTLAK